jgi:hypothetical protein
LVAWSTIDCIWTGKVFLHMSRLSTSPFDSLSKSMQSLS